MTDTPPGEREAGDGPGEVICSARGCRRLAAWAVVWNNPRIHTPDREKIWTACEEHREHLADYLRRRSMLLRVDALTDLPNPPG